MLHAPRFAAVCCAFIAAAVAPLRGDEAAAPGITPVWEVHANLAAEGMPANLRMLIQSDARDGKPSPASITIHGFKNPASPDADDWLVLLNLGEKIDAAWTRLLRDFHKEWGAPDELGRWIINDADAGLSFVLARRQQALEFTNSIENLGINPPSRVDPEDSRAIRGHIDLQALGKARTESELLRFAEAVSFYVATDDDDGMLVNISIRLIDPDHARQVHDAFTKALESEWLAMLSLPKPAVTNPGGEDPRQLNFHLSFDADQMERVVSAIILRGRNVVEESPAAAPHPDAHASESPQR